MTDTAPAQEPPQPHDRDQGALPMEAEAERWESHLRGAIAALAVLLPVALVLLVFSPVLRAGPDRSLLGPDRPQPNLHRLHRADLLYQAWLTSRNARTLATDPGSLFDTEHCAPMERSITLGVPLTGYGILAIPAERVSHNPVLAFNFAVGASLLIAYAGTLLLVRDLAGLWTAGIASGILFAFHPLRVSNIQHPAEWDLGWAAMACWLALRWARSGSWWWSALLGLSGALLIATSFYQTLAGALLLLPFGLWLLLEHGVRRIQWAQLAVAAALAGTAAAVIYSPYLETRSTDPTLLRFHGFYFVSWNDLRPGGKYFPGYPALGLGLLGLVFGRGPSARVRAPMVFAILLTGIVVTGPSLVSALSALLGPGGADVPIPYVWLAERIPGLDSIRLIPRLWTAGLFAVAVIAGIGAAAVIRRSPALLCPVVLAGCFLFAAVGATKTDSRRLVAYEASISPAIRSFYERVESTAADGALLEVPVRHGFATILDPDRILYSYYHRKRTSACFGSYRPSHLKELARLARGLPAAAARRRLRNSGFATVIVEGDTPLLKQYARRLAEGTQALPVLLEDRDLIAFDLTSDHRGGPTRGPIPGLTKQATPPAVPPESSSGYEEDP